MRTKRFLFLAPAFLFVASAVDADGPFKFFSVAPCRILDTRSGSGGRFAAGEIRHFVINTKCGIPSAAKMAALNFTVVSPTTEGYIIAYPYNPTTPPTIPNVSTVNWTAGESAIANGSIVSLTTGSTYNLSVSVAAQLDLIIDVTGYLQ